jgi:hypothetical protein
LARTALLLALLLVLPLLGLRSRHTEAAEQTTHGQSKDRAAGPGAEGTRNIVKSVGVHEPSSHRQLPTE